MTEEDVVVIKLLAKGCPLNTSAESILRTEGVVAKGDPLVLELEFTFGTGSRPAWIEVPHMPKIGLSGGEMALKEDSIGFSLEISTDSLPEGMNGIEVVLEHHEYHNTLSETNRERVKVIRPSISITGFRLKEERPRPGADIHCTVSLSSSSSEKIRGGIDLQLVDFSKEVIEVEGIRMSLSGEGDFDLVIPKGLIDWGDYDVIVKLHQKDAKPIMRTFEEALRIRPDSGIDVEPTAKGPVKVVPGQQVPLGFKVKNIGRAPVQARFDLTIPFGPSGTVLGGEGANLGSEEEMTLIIDSFVPEDIRNGAYEMTLAYEAGGEKKLALLTDTPLFVTEPHDVSIVSCVADMDFYSPGDMVVLRAYLEDKGALAGEELEVGLKIRSGDKVLFKRTGPVEVGAQRSLAQFEWVTPEKLRTGKLSAEIRVLDAKKSFKNLIQIEEPIMVKPLFVSVDPAARTAKRFNGKAVIPYLYENEQIIDSKDYAFKAGSTKRVLSVLSLDSRTKIYALDGRVVFGLDWRKEDTRQVFDSLFSYLVLTRLEHPGFVDDYCRDLEYLGYLLYNDTANICGAGPAGLDTWRRDYDKLRKKALGFLGGFKNGHFLFVQSLERDIKKELGLKNDKLVDSSLKRMDKALGRLLKRDIEDFEEKIQNCITSWTKLFNREIDFDPSGTDPADAREIYLKHHLALSVAALPVVQDLLDCYARAAGANYLDRELYNKMFRDKVLIHLLLGGRYALQSALDPYTPPEEGRRAVLDNLEAIKRMVKNTALAYNLTLDAQKNYLKNKDARNALAYIKRSINVKMDRTTVKGRLGGKSREKAELMNHGDSAAKVVVTTALPNEEWTLVEPVSSISKDVYISQQIKIGPQSFSDLFISFNLPKGLDRKSYKMLFYISPPYQELSPLLDRILEDEPGKLGRLKLPKLSGNCSGEQRKRISRLMDDYYRIKFVQERAQASTLSRKERGLFKDGRLVVSRYNRLAGVKDDSFLKAARSCGFFDIEKTTVTEGVVFKKKVETSGLLVKDHKNVEAAEDSIVEAGGSVYLSTIITRSLLDHILKILKPGYSKRKGLVSVRSPYIPPTISREYLYERELPGVLEKYARSGASDAISQKTYEKKLSKDNALKFSNKLIANSLKTWVQCLIDSDADVIRDHLINGDFEEWLRNKAGSSELANIIGGFATRIDEELAEGQINPDDVKRLLFQRLDKTPLKVQISHSTVKPLIRKLTSANPRAVIETLERLVEIGDPQSIDPIIEKLFDPHQETRLAAIDALGKIGDKRAVPPLEKIISYTNSEEERKRAQEVIDHIS